MERLSRGARPATNRQASAARTAVVLVSPRCAQDGCLKRSVAAALLCRAWGNVADVVCRGSQQGVCRPRLCGRRGPGFLSGDSDHGQRQQGAPGWVARMNRSGSCDGVCHRASLGDCPYHQRRTPVGATQPKHRVWRSEPTESVPRAES
nr:lasso peptide biosynthesis protein [Kutzneria buriramensis]